jgi:hypothetical protein
MGVTLLLLEVKENNGGIRTFWDKAGCDFKVEDGEE